MAFPIIASRRGLALAAAFGALAFALTARAVLGPELSADALLARAVSWRGEWWSLPAFMGLYLVATAVLVPAIAFHVTAGVVWGFAQGWWVAWLAANVACNVQFAMGRWLGPARVKAWLLARGWVRLVAELEHSGATAMMMVRQLPLPCVGVNVEAGASPMTWPQFVVGNAIGLLPSVTIYTLLSAALANGIEGAEREAIIGVVTAGAGVLLIAFVTRRWIRPAR